MKTVALLKRRRVLAGALFGLTSEHHVARVNEPQVREPSAREFGDKVVADSGESPWCVREQRRTNR